MAKFFSQPAIKITLFTALLTLILASLKLFFGITGESHALTADGFHSLSDILVDGMVLFAAHYGAQKADYNHPYGHGRIETAATFGLALILILTGLGIIVDAGKHLWGHLPVPKPEMITLWIALLTAVINEGLFRFTLKLSKNIKSDILAANAWHARSDVWVSAVVVLGILGAIAGYRHLDVIGAIIVGIMIIKLGSELGWKSISELVDTGVNEKTLKKIADIITAVPGVCTLHMLRTRTIKNSILVDVHILVSPRISVSEGHFIGDQVILALKKLPEISDTTVHVDPEDDEISHPSSQLPHRKQLVSLLKETLKDLPYADKLRDQDIRLHYLNGQIELEVFIPVNFLSGDAPNILAQYNETLKKLSVIDKFNIYFSHG
ncbi:MAG TPA: cation diffusion facilitator family transporter [Gammaproteobacteria bacterium]|nr:cation diffusion facilitator family transporter [Gammaproteobacteria bacterium]HEV2613078.1 cation diffusion facilitator family transporter [Gammaproteobacteria bacterium]